MFDAVACCLGQRSVVLPHRALDELPSTLVIQRRAQSGLEKVSVPRGNIFQCNLPRRIGALRSTASKPCSPRLSKAAAASAVYPARYRFHRLDPVTEKPRKPYGSMSQGSLGPAKTTRYKLRTPATSATRKKGLPSGGFTELGAFSPTDFIYSAWVDLFGNETEVTLAVEFRAPL